MSFYSILKWSLWDRVCYESLLENCSEFISTIFFEKKKENI